MVMPDPDDFGFSTFLYWLGLAEYITVPFDGFQFQLKSEPSLVVEDKRFGRESGGYAELYEVVTKTVRSTTCLSTVPIGCRGYCGLSLESAAPALTPRGWSLVLSGCAELQQFRHLIER